ncbi:cytochrome b [Chitiniphilus shinanonensis]|uniref:cytochrome b n=1 Tax=Chitiniphilus shinanonensis TaxID=553088 RepID=UPI00333ECD7B
MSRSATPARYHPLSVLMHWATALLALVTLGCILVATQFHPAPATRETLLMVHMVSGQTMFLLQLLQLLLFSAFGTPVPDGMDAQQVHVARCLHALLYGTVGFLACSGTLLAVSQAAGTEVLGWRVPLMLTGQGLLALREVHAMAGMGFVVFCGVHALLAIGMHHFGRRATLGKMAVEGELVDYLAAPQTDGGYARIDRPDLNGSA